MVILFKQTGDAPILKQNKVKVLLRAQHSPLRGTGPARWGQTCTPPAKVSAQCVPCCAQIDGQEKFAKLVEFLRKKLGKEQVVSVDRGLLSRGLAVARPPNRR